MDPRSLALALALSALSCSAPPPPPASCATLRPTLWVSTSDYASGKICAFRERSDCAHAELDVTTGDTVLAAHGALVVALKYARSTTAPVDEIVVYEPADDGTLRARGASQSPRLDGQTSANVRGYLAIDDRLAIFTRNDVSSLGVFDVQTRAVTANIALDALALDAPRAAPYAIAQSGSRAFVTLQRWDAARLDNPRRGAVAIVDPSAFSLVDADPSTPAIDAIELPLANPFGQVSVRGSTLFVPCAGALRTVGDGGVVRVDTRALRVIDTIAPEAVLQGNPLHVLALDDDRLLIVAITEPSPDDEMAVAHTRLIEWSIARAAAVRTWIDVPEYALTAPVIGRDGRVYIGDRGSEGSARPGAIVAFDPSSGARVELGSSPAPQPPYTLLPAR